MHRRNLLQSVAALPLLSLPSCLFTRPAAAGTPLRRVRPSDAAWPSAADWQTLRSAVGGNLIEVHPLFAPCESAPDVSNNHRSGATCAE